MKNFNVNFTNIEFNQKKFDKFYVKQIKKKQNKYHFYPNTFINGWSIINDPQFSVNTNDLNRIVHRSNFSRKTFLLILN